MIRRCHSPNDPAYPDYGGRGIQVCNDWHDFFRFETYVEKYLGTKPKKHTLGRIKNDLGYIPQNIAWQNWHIQAQNRRKVRSLENYTTKELLLELEKRGIYEQ